MRPIRSSWWYAAAAGCLFTATPAHAQPMPWHERASLAPLVPENTDRFGEAVALDGNTAVVGAPGFGPNTGAVSVFVRSAGDWSLQATLAASDGGDWDNFGKSVALEGDWLLVGAPGDGIGSVYVFQRSGTAWIERSKLTPSGDPSAALGDEFGESVVLDGGHAFVGAPRAAAGAVSGAGAVYTLQLVAGEWGVGARLSPPGVPVENAAFGHALALDGEAATPRLIVGAPGYGAVPKTFPPAGTARVFVRSPAGVWQHEGLLATRDGLGGSVAISGDRALVTRSGASDFIPFPPGSVFAFKRTGSTWSQQAEFRPADVTLASGGEVSTLALRGTTAILGSSPHCHGQTQYTRPCPQPSVGAAYVFDVTSGAWFERAEIQVAGASGLGSGVALDGPTALIGASPWGTGSATSGTAHLIELGGAPPSVPVLGTFGASLLGLGLIAAARRREGR